MGKVIILGNREFAQLLCHYVCNFSEECVVAFSVDEVYMNSGVICGYPVIPFESLETHFPVETYDVLLGIGYRNMNNVRKNMYLRAKNKGYRIRSFIHPSVYRDHVMIGEGNVILEHVVLSANTEIGNANIIWNGCNLSHNNVVGDWNYFAPSVVTGGQAHIKNNCFLGCASVVRSAVTLEDYTLVGAGTYINKDTQKQSVYVPQRSIKLRDKDCFAMGI